MQLNYKLSGHNDYIVRLKRKQPSPRGVPR